jgi:hypothetical protein
LVTALDAIALSRVTAGDFEMPGRLVLLALSWRQIADQEFDRAPLSFFPIEWPKRRRPFLRFVAPADSVQQGSQRLSKDGHVPNMALRRS